jgi:hypothetical protein
MTPCSIRSWLGNYSEAADPLLTPTRAQVCSRIIDRLSEIDGLIFSALPDSMAVKVGDIAVDYTAHIALLRGEASNLLKQLAATSGIPLLFDKYTGITYTETQPSTQGALSYVQFS